MALAGKVGDVESDLPIALFQSDLHPATLTFDTSGFLDGSVTAAMVASVLRDLHAPAAIRALRVVLPDRTDVAPLVATGFTVTRRTRLICYDLTLPDHPAMATDMPDGMAGEWVPRSGRADWAGWFAAHWAHYKGLHCDNPSCNLGFVGRAVVFGGVDLVEGLFVRDAAGTLRGFASLRTDQRIGWVGGNADFAACLLATALRRAAANGWARATVEVDDDDTALWGAAQVTARDIVATFLTWTWDRPAVEKTL